MKIKSPIFLKRGLTLVEVIVVIGIIGLLTSIIYVAVSEARANARDKQRMTEIKQLELLMKQYFEVYGEYPPEWGANDTGPDSDDYSGPGDGTNGGNFGLICANCPAKDRPINQLIESSLGKKFEDPRHNYVANGNYYYYDGNHLCAGRRNQAILIAAMETDAFVNIDEIGAYCDDGNPPAFEIGPDFGGEGVFNGAGKFHIIILGQGRN